MCGFTLLGSELPCYVVVGNSGKTGRRGGGREGKAGPDHDVRGGSSFTYDFIEAHIKKLGKHVVTDL